MPDRSQPQPSVPEAGSGSPTETTEPTGAPTGRPALLAALNHPPTRGQAVAGVLLALLGFAAVVQVNTVRSDTPYAGARRDDLVQLLQSVSAAEDRASGQYAELQDAAEALQDSTNQRAAALEEAQRQLDTLQVLAGTVGAVGPGVVITIDDPDGSVPARTLLNAVEELRDAGAEAIQVDDARIVAQTALADGSDPTDGQLLVGGRTVTAPYVIRAIGAAETLSKAAVFPGGLRDEVEALGGTVSVDTSDQVTITALAPAAPDDFVQPSS